MVETPKHYNDFLRKYGGVNPLGENCFILHWGGDPVRRLYVPEEFLAPYLNCWCLAEWTPPEEFGTPESVESLGVPFPSRGAYIPIWVFKYENEPVRLDSEGLNLETLRMILHVVMTHKHDSLLKRVTLLKDEAARVKAAKTKLLVERIEDGAPAFLDSVSFQGQQNCNSAVKQKMEQLEKNYDRIIEAARRLPRGGMFQANA